MICCRCELFVSSGVRLVRAGALFGSGVGKSVTGRALVGRGKMGAASAYGLSGRVD